MAQQMLKEPLRIPFHEEINYYKRLLAVPCYETFFNYSQHKRIYVDPRKDLARNQKKVSNHKRNETLR